MRTFVIGSVSGALTATLLFGTIAVVCGYGVTRILRQLAAPEDQLPYLGTTRVARRVIGSVVTAVILVAVWHALWSGFYSIKVGDRALLLHYRFPPRDVTLAVDQIARIDWRRVAKSRHLVVTLTSGAQYRSAQSSVGIQSEAVLLAEVRRLMATVR